MLPFVIFLSVATRTTPNLPVLKIAKVKVLYDYIAQDLLFSLHIYGPTSQGLTFWTSLKVQRYSNKRLK